MPAFEGRCDDHGRLELVDDVTHDGSSPAQFLRIATFERWHEIEEAQVVLAEAGDVPGAARFRLAPRGQVGRLILRQVDHARNATQTAVAQAKPASGDDAVIFVGGEDQQPARLVPIHPALDHADPQQGESGEGQQQGVKECQGLGEPEDARNTRCQPEQGGGGGQQRHDDRRPEIDSELHSIAEPIPATPMLSIAPVHQALANQWTSRCAFFTSFRPICRR